MQLLFSSCLFVMLFACSKNNDNDKLPASLQTLIDSNKSCVCKPYIKEYQWHSRIIYLVGNSGPTCNWTPLYFNKKGDPVKLDSDYNLSDFLAEAQLKKLVWSCSTEY